MDPARNQYRPRNTIDSDGDIVMQDYHVSPGRMTLPPTMSKDNEWIDDQERPTVFGYGWSPHRLPIPQNMRSNEYVPPDRLVSSPQNVRPDGRRTPMDQPISSPESPLPQSHTPVHQHLDPRADPFLPLSYLGQQGILPAVFYPPPPAVSSENVINPRNVFIRQPEQLIPPSRRLPLPRNLPSLSTVLPRQQVPQNDDRSRYYALFSDQPPRFEHDQSAQATQIRMMPPLIPTRPAEYMERLRRTTELSPTSNNIYNSYRLPFDPVLGGQSEPWANRQPNLPPERPIAVPVSRKKEKKIKTAPCTACMDELEPSKLVPAPCNCKYCKSCLNDLFRSGCSSILNFPPSCHGRPLRINVFGELLDPDVLSRYKQIEIEFSSQKPLYCALPTCSAFLSESSIVEEGNYGICMNCTNCTCRLCKMLLHDHNLEKKTCPKEPENLLALRKLGDREEWRQCPSCNNMVEKVDGCDHMECPCGVEFCYRCGSFYNEWDECDCAVDTNSDEENSDEDDETFMWPDHRLMMDAFGRPRCTHNDADSVDGDICGGCLIQRGRTNISMQFLQCNQCLIQLCAGCYDGIQTGSNN